MSSEELSVDAYDRDEQRHRHNMEVEKQRTARDRHKNRSEVTAIIAIGSFIVTAILGIVYAVWEDASHADEDAVVEQQREQTCLENKGVWLPKSVIVGDTGMCVTKAGAP